MKIINIEARTFESMMERFEAFTKKVNSICGSKARQSGRMSDIGYIQTNAANLSG